jgi:protein tyrosine/serine phosphatase
LSYLKEKYGIKTIIDLRGAVEDFEEKFAMDNGISLMHIPIKNIFRRTDKEGIRNFLSLFEKPEKIPVLIHCRKGMDRTGVLVAVYRVRVQKQDEKYSLKEAKDKRMNLYWRSLLFFMLKLKKR